MARFGKAQPKQARFKMALYGPPGSGKTFTALLMAEGLAKVRGRRVKYIDTEHGTDFYAMDVPQRSVHPQAFDFDAIYTRSLTDILDALEHLNPAEDGVIVIDSMSHIWDAAMEAYHGKMTKIGSIPMHAWGPIKKPYKRLVNLLIYGPYDTFILGRQKNLFDKDDDGELEKVGVGMRAEGETAYEPHICMRMESKRDQKADREQTKGTVSAFVEKDRTGILQGQEIQFPSFKTIEPLLPLLGAEQASAEDEDERAAKDGELLDKLQVNGKGKESLVLAGDFQERLSKALDLASLWGVVTEIKKAKRKLTEEHWGSLVQFYEVRKQQLASAQAPELQ